MPINSHGGRLFITSHDFCPFTLYSVITTKKTHLLKKNDIVIIRHFVLNILYNSDFLKANLHL